MYRKKLIYSLLLLLSLVSIIFRYPQENHENGIDGLLMHTLSNTIMINGNIGWFINIFSLIGFFPFSYASGFLVLIPAMSQVLGISTEMTILFAAISLGVFGIFTSFMMAREISTRLEFVFLVCFFFSVSPLFIRFTSWQASTRTIFIAFMPIWIWLSLRIYNVNFQRVRFVILTIIVTALMLTFHRVANLLFLPFAAYLVSAFVVYYYHRLTDYQRTINYLRVTWFLTIIVLMLSQAYRIGIYEDYNLGQKYESGRFLEGVEGHIILINMFIDYGSRTGIFSVVCLLGTLFIMFESNIKIFVRLFLLNSIFLFAGIITLGLYATLVLLPFICILTAYGFIKILEIYNLRGNYKKAFFAVIIVFSLLFTNFMLSTWGTYGSTINDDEYDVGVYINEYADKNITLVSDGDWGAKIFTISDSQYMMDDSSPLPLAYGWLNEEYTSASFNFSDVLVRKTILESSGSTDFEEYWEDLSLRIYSYTADSSETEREIFNIKYALNHKNVVDNEYLLITSSQESRYSVFENSEIEIYYLG